MILKIRIAGKQAGDYMNSNDIINAACGFLDNEGFEVEYISHSMEKNELIIDSDLEAEDDDDDDKEA